MRGKRIINRSLSMPSMPAALPPSCYYAIDEADRAESPVQALSLNGRPVLLIRN